MLFLITVTICSLVFIFLARKKTLELSGPIKVFNFVWGVISLIAAIRIDANALRNISVFYVHISIFIFIISVNLGFLLFLPSKNNVKDNDIFKGVSLNTYEINEKKMYLLILIVIVLLLVFLRDSVQHVLSGNLDAIRVSIYYEQVGTQNSLFKSGFETILVQWVLNGLILAINIITISSYTNKKSSLNLVLFSIFAAILFAVLTGGRIMILKIILLIIFSLFIVNSYKIIRFDYRFKNIFLKRKWDRILLLIIALGILSILITVGRSNSDSVEIDSIFETFFDYLSSPIIYYSKLLDVNIKSMELLYGGGFFAGITQLIDIILKNIMEYNFLFPFQHISNETSVFLMINPNQYYNAFPTMIYYLYRDGRLLGLFVGSLTFAYILSKVYKNFKVKNTIRSESIYLLSLYIIAMGALRWEPALANFWVTLFFVYVLSSNFFFREILNIESDTKKVSSA